MTLEEKRRRNREAQRRHRRIHPPDAEERQKHRQYSRRYCRTIEGRYRLGLARAKRRNIPFRITLEQYVALLIPGTCHYCDGPLPTTGLGLDRKDNTLGYLFSNLVTCCTQCNNKKNAYMSYEQAVEALAS